MKCITLLLSLSIFTAARLSAQENSLLWEISGNGLKEPSYLYGTIHMIGKSDFFVRAEIDTVFSKCSQVAFEIDLDDIAQLNSAQAWVNLPEDLKLDEIVPPGAYQKIKTYFSDSLGLNLVDFNSQKPFAVYQQFLSGLIQDEQESYEMYFLMKSISAQKSIVGLEKITDEFRVIDAVPYEQQIQWLMDGIDSIHSYRENFKELVSAYKEENLNKIETLLSDDPVVMGELADDLLQKRNQNWMDEIENYINTQPTFIAVGAAHLPGDDGLIRLLKAKGYIVKPILKN